MPPRLLCLRSMALAAALLAATPALAQRNVAAAQRNAPAAKPQTDEPNYGLMFYGLSTEAAKLRETLLLDNYQIRPASLRALTEAQNATHPLPPSRKERARIVEDFQRAIDDLMRFDETTELEFAPDTSGLSFGLGRAPSLRVVAPPKRLHLTANVRRLLPVLLTNKTSETLKMTWRAGEPDHVLESGEMTVFPHGKGRMFAAISTGQGKQDARILFRCSSGEVRVKTPIELRPSGKLKVRVKDEKGAPTATRLYINASDGWAYVPDGATHRMTDWNDSHYYHVPGDFSVTLAAGEAKLTLVKGFEYLLKDVSLNVPAGETTPVDVPLQRWSNLPENRWFSGDGHIHMSYGGPIKVGPKDVMLMLEAEDLNVGNMVVANMWGNDVLDREWFQGFTNKLSKPPYFMRWAEEYRNNFLGHLILYNLKKLTDPIYSGFPNTPFPYDFPLNADIADQTLEQGGFVTGAHPGWGQSEHAIDVALGKMGGIETVGFGSFTPGAVEVLHGLWNCGFRTVATAGTDSFLNVVARDPLGAGRCYARVEGPLSYESWVAAMQAGRTFVSNAPILSFEVEDKGPGEEIRRILPKATTATLTLRARAESQWPLTELTIFYNGKIVATAKADAESANPGPTSTPAGAAAPPPGANAYRLELNQKIDVPDSGWIAARCSGPPNKLVLSGGLFRGTGPFAHTTPVWIVINGRPVPPSPDAERLVKWTDDFTQQADVATRYANDAQREHMRQVFGAARDKFAAMAKRYQESRKAK